MSAPAPGLAAWLHPDLSGLGREFKLTLDEQAVTGVKVLGAALVVLAVAALVLLRTLYTAETVKTAEGLDLSLRFLALGALMLGALKVPVLRRHARSLLLVVMFAVLADSLVLQLRLIPVHRSQLGLFIAALCFIAFTFMPYRPWIVGLFAFFGLAVILAAAATLGLELHPYKNTSLFWLVAQFLSLGSITFIFRAAILNMQIDIDRSRSRLASMQEDIEDYKTLLARTEDRNAEFKSSFRFDHRLNQVSPEITQAAVRAIAGFLNSDGGALIFGVDDTGRPVGIEKDLQTLKKQNTDGFQLAVIQAVSDAMGAESCQNLRFSFLKVENRPVCVLHVRPSPQPVYVESKSQSAFFIRTGNSTQALDTKHAVEYIRRRWK